MEIFWILFGGDDFTFETGSKSESICIYNKKTATGIEKEKTAIAEIDLKHPIIIKMKCKQNIFKNCSIGLTLISKHMLSYE